MSKNQNGRVLKEKTETGIHGSFHIKPFTDMSTLPQELCPRRAKLEDSANQALALIKRRRRTGEVEFTVRIRAQQWEKREHTQCLV